MKKILALVLLITVNVYGSEEFPAGSGTTSDLSVQAFSHPLSGTRGQDRREFVVGNSFFQSVWVTSPASTTARDGLGPTFNAISCTACHFKDGRGRGLPDADGKVDISLLFRLRVKNADGSVSISENYGGQFNPQGVQGVPGEGDAMVNFETITGSFSDGEKFELAKPKYSFVNLAFGAFNKNTIFSPRVGPQMIGLGLIENIDESDIRKNADPDDLNKDGISGRVNTVYSLVQQKYVLGRFGWKAGQPSLLEQNAGAFHGDIGITSYLHPEEECPLVQIDCAAKRTQEDISEQLLGQVTLYTQLLAVPVRRDVNSPNVIRGKAIFNQMNCQGCHTASYVTGKNSQFDVLNNQTIYPYSDFLLHDMGDALADDVGNYKNEGDAGTREWRTPPLWGIGMFKIVNGHTRYLHDGRARSVSEAILWHDGEGAVAKAKFLKLAINDRNDLITFLNSL